MFFDEMDLRRLEDKIEKLRNEMIIIGMEEGLCSEKTISISQRLDYYIAKYQSHKNRPNSNPGFY